MVGIHFTTARVENLGTLISKGVVLPPGDRFTYLFDIRADPVCVKGLPRSLNSGSQAMFYFGRSDGLLVLYNLELQRTITWPATGVELVFVPYNSKDWQLAANSLKKFDKTCSKLWKQPR